MKLQQKTLLIIGATLAGMVGLLYVTSSTILLKAIEKAEQRNNRQTVQSVLNVLTQTEEDFDNRLSDWAAWDDTYQFIQNKNQNYIASNLVPGTLSSLKLNLILYVNADSKLVYGTGFDLNRHRYVPIPEIVKQHLVLSDRLLNHPDQNSSLGGILIVPQGAMLISSRPILPSEKNGPIRGTFIGGRLLNADEIARLSRITHLTIDLRSVNDANLPPNFQIARSALSEQNPFFFEKQGTQAIAGYVLIKDIYHQPALLLRVKLPEDPTNQRERSLLYLIGAVVLSGLIFGAVTLLLLQQLVLSRVARLSREVRQIEATGNFSLRATVSGRDELPMLACDINAMLESLEQSQRAITQKNQEMSGYIQQVEQVIEAAAAVENNTFESVQLKDVANRNDKLGQLARVFTRMVQTVKAREDALRQSEERFRSLVSNIPGAIYRCHPDADSSLVFISTAIEKISGCPASEFMNHTHPLRSIIHPDDRVLIEVVVSHALIIQEPFMLEYRVMHQDGSIRWVYEQGRGVFDAEGEPVYLDGTIFDVTDRKQAEEALRIAEENYRSIFDHALEGIFQSSPDGRFINVNSAMARIYGYQSPEEMLASITDIGAQVYVEPSQRDLIKRCLDQQGQIKNLECQIYRKDGSIIWIKENTRAVRDSENEILYYEGLVEDVTQRKYLEAELKRQLKELQIEIDHQKRQQEVALITKSAYFQELQEEISSVNLDEFWS